MKGGSEDNLVFLINVFFMVFFTNKYDVSRKSNGSFLYTALPWTTSKKIK